MAGVFPPDLEVLMLALAFASLLSSGPEPRLVARIPEGFEFVAGSLRFSRDGSKCVGIVEKDKKFHTFAEGKVGAAAYDRLSWPNIDASGAHSAFLAFENPRTKKTGTFSVVYDGKVVASDVWIGPVSLDPAKGQAAYWRAQGYINRADGSLEPQAATLHWGKYKSSKWQFAESKTAPRFTPDGKILVTNAARGNGDWNVITVDEKGRDDKHGSGSIFDAAPRPAGRAVAFTFANLVGEALWLRYDQHYLVAIASLDERGSKSLIGQLGGEYDSCGSPVFSEDGLHVACKVLLGGKMGVAIDDQPGARCEYDFVDEIVLDPKGSKAGFVASKGCKLDVDHGMEVLSYVRASGGRWFVVHDGLQSAEYQRARMPKFSPDGTSFAYVAKLDGKWRVYAGSKQSEAADDVGWTEWAEDGGSISYGCLEGSEIWNRTLERD